MTRPQLSIPQLRLQGIITRSRLDWWIHSCDTQSFPDFRIEVSAGSCVQTTGDGSLYGKHLDKMSLNGRSTQVRTTCPGIVFRNQGPGTALERLSRGSKPCAPLYI